MTSKIRVVFMLFALVCALFLFGCGAGNERPYNHDRDLNDVDIDETIIYDGNYVYRELNDYSVALEGYIGEEESISIPSTYGPYDVIEIRHLTNDFIKEIIIPESVKEISKNAIVCSQLNSIKVNENNKIFDSRNNCNAIIETKSNVLLKGCINTIIPDEVIEIAPKAFYYSEISEINIPKNIEMIGELAFSKCVNLNKIIIDKENEIYASYDANVIVEKETNKLLFGCATSVIPSEVIEIASYAFDGLDTLTEVDIPEGVKIIDSYAFTECNSLETILLPESIELIDIMAFNSCNNIININYKGSSDSWNEVIQFFEFDDVLKDLTIFFEK